MTVPTLELTHCCCLTLQGKLSPAARIGFVAFDVLISITTFVVGILGATAVSAMPAAAAYGLIGISVGITLLYLATCIKCRTCPSPTG